MKHTEDFIEQIENYDEFYDVVASYVQEIPEMKEGINLAFI